jgi:hypothetical protein
MDRSVSRFLFSKHPLTNRPNHFASLFHLHVQLLAKFGKHLYGFLRIFLSRNLAADFLNFARFHSGAPKGVVGGMQTA